MGIPSTLLPVKADGTVEWRLLGGRKPSKAELAALYRERYGYRLPLTAPLIGLGVVMVFLLAGKVF